MNPRSAIARAPKRYSALLEELKQCIRAARLHAALSVNRELVLLYWGIGREILARQHAKGWGAKIIDRLAADLRCAFPEMTGISARNLRHMRTLARVWPDLQVVQQVVAQLPWGHNTRLLDTVETAAEREWYARQAIQHGWSRAVLAHQIESGLHGRRGDTLTNFTRKLPEDQSDLAQQIVKDPYSFDLLSCREGIQERDLERNLIEHLQSLLKTDLRTRAAGAFGGRSARTWVRCALPLDLKAVLHAVSQRERIDEVELIERLLVVTLRTYLAADLAPTTTPKSG
jgi:predicted nuclease of restriction endonuclease-like (RecB) superfamily